MTATRAATANVLAALALAVTDQIDATASGATNSMVRGDSATSAISALDQFLDRPSVTRVCEVLGLSHSGAVRLLDRLAGDGLITRQSGRDSRTLGVLLTRRGRYAAQQARGRRAAYLDAVLDELSATEIETLHGLLARIMSQVVTVKDGGAWICRRCDLDACGRADGHCPAAIAAARKHAGTHGFSARAAAVAHLADLRSDPKSPTGPR